jgi:REP element-mobilizing transposase RayT
MTDEKEWVCRGNPRQEEIYSRKFGKPQSGSLSMIINHFKGSVKRWCNQNEYKGFLWQRNYYEHVILNDKELNNISEYIKINPQNWSKDEYKI